MPDLMDGSLGEAIGIITELEMMHIRSYAILMKTGAIARFICSFAMLFYNDISGVMG